MPCVDLQPGVLLLHAPRANAAPWPPCCSSIDFETPLFSGRACVWLRGAPGGAAVDEQFAGRRRRSLVTVQGRFRRPVPLDDLVTGQEFGRVENLPPAWLVEGVLLKVGCAGAGGWRGGPGGGCRWPCGTPWRACCAC